MRPKGPPLNAMRAFEAAARNGSIAVAAEELNVTPGAVSQHVKTLESWASVELFRRNPQGVELTSAGRSLVQGFTDAFDALANATHALRNLSPDANIHIAALPSIAQLWLPARLGKIREAFPHLNFSVTALETPPSLSRELFDVSVFFADHEGGDDKVIVADDEIMPVCSPRLAEQRGMMEILTSTPLLHDQSWRDDWAQWSTMADVALADPHDGPRYSLYSLAVEEAKSGAGLLMGHMCLIKEALAAGTLMPVFDKTFSTGRSLVLQLPHRTRRRAAIDDIVDLLRN